MIGAMTKRSACPLDMSTLVKLKWLLINPMPLSMLLGRVEGAANVADAPSHRALGFSVRINASYRQPLLLGWLRDIYALPDLNA